MSNRSLRYYLSSYRRLAMAFRNSAELVWAHHCRRDVSRAVFWDGREIHNVDGRGGLVDTIVEIWGLQEYTRNGFYTPRDGDVVLDVGANIGLFSIWIARRAPLARVFAFEPMPENSAALLRNLKGWAHRIELREVAIGAATGVGVMENGGERTLDHRLATNTGQAGATVPVMTLDDAVGLADKAMIDLLKIDIEGAEADVLAAASPSALRRVRRIAIEYHDHIRPGTLRDVQKLLAPNHRITDVSGTSYGILHAELIESSPVSSSAGGT